MTPITDPQIEQYCVSHTTALANYFKELTKDTQLKTTAPQMQVGPLEGSFLKMLVALTGAKRVLELGTFTGYSAMAMAEALPPDGKMITCDIDPINTKMAREYWMKSPHGSKIELCLGPGLETIGKLSGSFDLVFIDADKGNYINYWEACVPKLPIGGLIVVDNVLWSGRVLNPKEESDRQISAFNEHALKDLRMESVMLPVRDGMLLARRIR